MSWLCKLELRRISEVLLVNQRRKNGEEQMTKNRRWEEQTRLRTYSCGNCYEKVTMIVIHTMKPSWGTMRNPLTLSWRMHSFSGSPGMIASQDLSGRLASTEVIRSKRQTMRQEVKRFTSSIAGKSSIHTARSYPLYRLEYRRTSTCGELYQGQQVMGKVLGMWVQACHLRANMWLK